MAELVLTAETGRDTGTRSSRRLRREGRVPAVVYGLGQDPAQSSSIVLTTVTDVVGFFSFLGIATLLMDML